MLQQHYIVHNFNRTSDYHMSDCDCNCNCACATPKYGFKKSRRGGLVSDNGRFIATSVYTDKICEDAVAVLGANHPFVVMDEETKAFQSVFSRPRKFEDVPSGFFELWGKKSLQNTFDEMLDIGLLLPEDEVSYSVSDSTDTLIVWLHVTDRCNFNCSYCWSSHTSKDMSLSVGLSTLEMIFAEAQSNGYAKIKLKYAGGEPLLHFDLVVSLHEQALLLARRYSIALEGVILSNGSLVEAYIVEQMKSLDLRLMISLDGIGNLHNCQRSYANGRMSFADVAKGIDISLDHNLIPDISSTISSRNAKGIPELVAWLLEKELPFSINFYRENDRVVCRDDLRLETEVIVDAMLASYKVIEENLPRRCLLSSLLDRVNLAHPHQHTCAAGWNYIVVDTDGNISKCQMAMNAPIANINLTDILGSTRNSSIGNVYLSVEEKEDCRDCEWRYWCSGGCPLVTYRATGRYGVKSPYCDIYKALLPEVVRLEGLRLLKYHANTD